MSGALRREQVCNVPDEERATATTAEVAGQALVGYMDAVHSLAYARAGDVAG